jgi:NAD(P)-dependent dehydrogenase (short-subunit alcohol dehydrogenase family)
MLLQDKNAIVYGAGGTIGGAVAEAFAREGARVWLVGRTGKTLDAVAAAIVEAGGRAEVAVLDATDAGAVEAHAAAVAEAGGSLDISLNLVSRGDVQGVPLADIAVEDLLRPAITGLTATIVTAQAAARRMTAQGSGVILALNSGSVHGSPMMGGTGPADAATDTLIRNLGIELGPAGVRALGVWCAGVPESFTPQRLAAVNATMQFDEAQIQGLLGQLASMRMLRRNPSLAQIAETITFLASDRAGGITATWVNVTGGMFAS